MRYLTLTLFVCACLAAPAGAQAPNPEVVAPIKTFIDSFNKGDAAAAASAKKLPGSPANAVAEAYKTLADAPTSAYYKAREKAAEADNALRTM